jgi:hypothetical protein
MPNRSRTLSQRSSSCERTAPSENSISQDKEFVAEHCEPSYGNSKNMFRALFLNVHSYVSKLSAFHKQATMLGSIRKVDAQHLDRRTSNGCQSDQPRSVPGKMFRPDILARVKERLQSEAIGIVASDIWAFVAVARQASPGQIHRCRASRMLLRSDVIQLKRLNVAFVRNMAIFTAASGSITNQLPTRDGHWSALFRKRQ